MAVGEELDGVDIGLMASKGLHSLASANIPELGESIASTGDEGVLVGGVEADAHDIAEMVGKLGNLLARLDIPLHAGHVARRRQDAAVVDKSAAGQVSGMTRQLPSDPRRSVTLLVEVVDGADVVKTTTSDEVTAGGISAGHDPG